MKLKKFLLGVALCTTSSLIFLSCKKDDSLQQTITQPNIALNLKMGGSIPDDPLMVAKIPVLISADFLKANKVALLSDPLSFNGAISSEAFRGGKPGSDRTAPSVKIITPSNSTTVSGIVNIEVSASDNVGVNQVSTSINGVALSTSSKAPYTFSWNTSGVASGTHTISATARDAAGNYSSTTIQVGINSTPSGDVTSPIVSITSPASGSSITAGAIVTVAVSASDNVGVSAVNFSLDGTLKSTSSSAPYSFSWNTTNVSSGTHTLTATAKDAAGNTSSYSIVVTINATVVTSPTFPASFSLLMPPVGYQGGEGSCVAFATTYAALSVEKFYQTNATSYSFSTNIFSPEFVYNQTKFGDCGSGTSTTTALNLIKNSGACTWQSMPYDYLNGCSLLPTNSQISEASNNKIASYSWIYGSDRSMIKTMLLNKHVIIIGITPDQSFYDANAGFIWSSLSGAPGAGHTLVICGYDDAKNAYRVMNSWGTTWGDSGYSWIDYDFLPYAGASVCYVITG